MQQVVMDMDSHRHNGRGKVIVKSQIKGKKGNYDNNFQVGKRVIGEGAGL